MSILRPPCLPGRAYGSFADKPLAGEVPGGGPATWPVTLPQAGFPFIEGLGRAARRFEVDAGPAKVARRYTHNLRSLQVRILFTRAELETFRGFYRNTLLHGSLPFDWLHPRTQQPALLRFTTTPSYTPLGCEHWLADLALEVLP